MTQVLLVKLYIKFNRLQQNLDEKTKKKLQQLKPEDASARGRCSTIFFISVSKALTDINIVMSQITHAYRHKYLHRLVVLNLVCRSFLALPCMLYSGLHVLFRDHTPLFVHYYMALRTLSLRRQLQELLSTVYHPGQGRYALSGNLTLSEGRKTLLRLIGRPLIMKGQ